jgi:hypothetical protein
MMRKRVWGWRRNNPDLLTCRPCGVVFAHAWGLKDHQIRGCPVDEPLAKRCKREDDGLEGILKIYRRPCVAQTNSPAE